jgi:phage gp37-like protein
MIIAQVENAIIERLSAASRLGVLGYSLREVDTLPTDLDDRLPQYVQNFPAAWVAFGGWPEAIDMGQGDVQADGALFHVVVGASSLRNEKAQRHGGAPGEVGSYQLVADVIGLLNGQSFGLPMSGLKPGRCTPLYSGKTQDSRKVSLFGLAFTARLDLTTPAALGGYARAIGDFSTFDVGWDVRSGAAPDFSDHINLPQGT